MPGRVSAFIYFRNKRVFVAQFCLLKKYTYKHDDGCKNMKYKFIVCKFQQQRMFRDD